MSQSVLLRIRPPSLGEFTLLSFENFLKALDSQEPFSLELSREDDGASMLIRSNEPDRVVEIIHSRYPDAVVESLEADEDPLTMRQGEIAYTRTLTPEGSEWLPLLVYDDTRVLQFGSDPFIDVLGGMLREVQPGERLLSRMMLTQKSHDWSEGLRQRAMSGAGSENQQSVESERQQQMGGKVAAASGTPSGAGSAVFLWMVVAALGLGLLGWLAWTIWQSDMQWLLVPLALGVIVIAGIAIWVLNKLGVFTPTTQTYYDPDQVALRVSGAAFTLEVQLLVFVSKDASEERIQKLMQSMVAVYGSFDNPLGCRFAVGSLRVVEDTPGDKLKPTSVTGGGIVGIREVAALWHMPGESARVLGLERSGSRRLPIPVEMEQGIPVGLETTTEGGRQVVHLPDEAMRRHHLYVARTQMGKSTLMGHLVGQRMLAKAMGKNKDAIVVVDPHADLVASILKYVPRNMGPEVRLIDLADMERCCGINLLDTHVFLDRDNTVDTVVKVLQSLWESWGSRMQAIIEYTLSSLYEANKNMPREEQYTFLDARLMLTDDDYRNEVLRNVEDSYLLNWWQNDFGVWRQEYMADALAPVQTRLSYYSRSAVARRILGQRYCTLDISEIIRQGKVLLISTDQGAVGENVAALVGAALLNLVETLVRAQGELPANERRGAMVVVDEMQAIPGVRYEEMLAQLGKFGGVLVLATQSLSKLDELSPTMRDTLLANIGSLCVFQVNAVDAERLLRELDVNNLNEEHITGLPPHHCYGRVNIGGVRPAFYSMELLKPLKGIPELAQAIREASSAYTRSRAEVDAEQTHYMDDQMEAFRTSLDSERIDPGMDFAQVNGNARGGRRKHQSNGTTE